MAGSAFAFPGPQMTPKAFAKLIEDEKVTLAAGVPTIWSSCVRRTSSLFELAEIVRTR